MHITCTRNAQTKTRTRSPLHLLLSKAIRLLELITHLTPLAFQLSFQGGLFFLRFDLASNAQSLGFASLPLVNVLPVEMEPSNRLTEHVGGLILLDLLFEGRRLLHRGLPHIGRGILRPADAKVHIRTAVGQMRNGRLATRRILLEFGVVRPLVDDRDRIAIEAGNGDAVRDGKHHYVVQTGHDDLLHGIATVKVQQQVLQFAIFVVEMPSIPNEQHHGLAADALLGSTAVVLQRLVIRNAQLRHVENLPIERPAQHQVVRSLLVVRSERKQGTIVLGGEKLETLLTFVIKRHDHVVLCQ
mmetsp:Transcript_23738/g.68249  ORF Transcript_23738/g.68249 Transcript_23738/m.68249 type:complete len:300 (-) Transcript_23738:266-1165(-)